MGVDLKNKNELILELHEQWNLIVKNQTDKTHLQFMRYILVGALAFVVDFSFLFICTDLVGIHYLISASIGFIMGLIINYLLSIKWVFNRRNVENKLLEFQIFSIIGFFGLFLNEYLLWLFTDYFLIYYLFSKILAAIIILLWNFFARKFILFNSKTN